jgi:hypothetical protein
MIRRHATKLLLGGALVLAAATGVFASIALSAGPSQAVVTTTINAAVGTPGPAGPKGDPGPPGAKGDPGPAGGTTCPDGFEVGEVVFNHPGGHVTLYTCIQG